MSQIKKLNLNPDHVIETIFILILAFTSNWVGLFFYFFVKFINGSALYITLISRSGHIKNSSPDACPENKTFQLFAKVYMNMVMWMYVVAMLLNSSPAATYFQVMFFPLLSVVSLRRANVEYYPEFKFDAVFYTILRYSVVTNAFLVALSIQYPVIKPLSFITQKATSN